MKTLELCKGDDRFIIQYAEGDEAAVLDHLIAWVNGPLPFDWFDAAVMSHQLGQRLSQQLWGLIPKEATP